MKRGFARFWYRFRNWFRFRQGPGEPLRFLCGSEEELRRVTTWACHSSLSLFRSRNFVIVRYCASTNRRERGFHEFLSSGDLLKEMPSGEWASLCKLRILAAEYNRFRGTEWSLDPRYETFPVLQTIAKVIREGVPFVVNLYDEPLEVRVTVHTPSAHERAEALLSLSEWLDGKVSEQEKRELLQLPEDVGL